MHWLSSKNRSEFLAVPELVRLEFAGGRDGKEPTLLVKANNVRLKYIVKGAPTRLILMRLGENKLFTGLQVQDDVERPATLWSIVEGNEEVEALRAILLGSPCQVFLFNEIAVNVAWSEVRFPPVGGDSGLLLDGLSLGRADYETTTSDVRAKLDHLQVTGEIESAGLLLPLPSQTWRPIHSTLITNQALSSPIALFDDDEGGQQEEFIVWLTDNLHPKAAARSPQIPDGRGKRELTDMLLSHEFGSTLFESKTLSILARDGLPSLTALAKSVTGHIEKAQRQLRGAIRRLKQGVEVTDLGGKLLDVERSQPVHAIILVPDLDLVTLGAAAEMKLMHDFGKATGAFLHILDPSELLRVVQAADMIAARGKTTTPMMAFDYYLMQRAERAAEAGRLVFSMLLRIEGNGADGGT